MIADQDDKSIRAGLLYFFIAHAGSVLIMIAFFLMWRESGSLDFDSFRQLSLSPAMASVVFLLGFSASVPKRVCYRCTAGCRRLTRRHRLTPPH